MSALLVSSVGFMVVLAALGREPVVPRTVPLSDLYLPASDTDSTAVLQQPLAVDSSLTDSNLAETRRADSSRADTSTADTLVYVPRYLPSRYTDTPTATFFDRRGAPLTPGLGHYWNREVYYDSLGHYTATERVGDHEVRYALTQDFDEFRRTRMAYDMQRNWDELVFERERARQRQNERGGLGVNIVVPGGRQSAFSTIFGKPQVDLRVHGQAQIRAGFDYRKSDQQASTTGQSSQVDPDFKQDLRLGITGTIGDKLRINVNWDTNNQFDYQNQLKLQYTGYEDEIIQNIEAGNVFLQTPSTLIRGGQSLFGIKSEFQLGGLHLTTVASQEEGQANTLSLEGGAQTTEFSRRPTDYDDATHFFLSYYFRNRWNDAHLAAPGQITKEQGFGELENVEVWRLERSSSNAQEDRDVCRTVAIVDLGEPADILDDGRAFTQAVMPNVVSQDQYTDADIATLRDGDSESDPADHLRNQIGLSDADFQVGDFKLLQRGTDYTYDPILGFISLNSSLGESEALAVSFSYRAGGRSYTVGDLQQDGVSCGTSRNDDYRITKLLRPETLTSHERAAWWLEMRNIYSLGSAGIEPNEFELFLEYAPPGRTATERLPDVGGQETLLQMLGLDRVNVNGSRGADQQFDYIEGVTIDQSDGLIIFPTLEPFGRDLEAQLGDQPELLDRYVYHSLYTEKKSRADDDSELNVYQIRGSFKGSKPSFYDLRTFAGLVEGSVRVTSGGTPLQEGTDYTVDYQGGTVNIINDAYLTAGRDIEISYEQNSLFNMQKKTLLGARADYELGDRLALGATIMRLTEKSPVDKFRIGEEPVANTLWGLDGSFQAEPRWLTRAVDALPLVQTRARSSITVTGEVAQLRPGHTETLAFEQTRRRLQDAGYDFKSDELKGISYIDGFEGFENTFSLKQPASWRLAAAPDSIRGYTQQTDGVEALTHWRATLGWYQLNRNTLERVDAEITPAASLVRTEDVFPNKPDTGNPGDDFIETLDLYFNPRERGPYNYTRNLPDFFRNPKNTWGGITTRIPEGYRDFDEKNVEFVEFIFRPYAENTDNDPGPDARLYVDLGVVSEDVIPNGGDVNSEDGLALDDITENSIDAWSRQSRSHPQGVLNIDEAKSRTEDLGLDGLASAIAGTERYPNFATEAGKFTDFMAALDPDEIDDPLYRAEVAKARYDPSADDYHHYREGYFDRQDYYPRGASVQQRFSRYFSGTEFNGFESQNRLAVDSDNDVRQGISRYPDSEDLDLNSRANTENSYYQYELPLTRSELDARANSDDPSDYVVGEIRDGNTGTGWYLVRIPVQSPDRRQVGDITDFSKIKNVRIWTTGHDVPATMRFASFELVGSQWRKSESVAGDLEDGSALVDTAGMRLSISSVNNEENSGTYAIPNGAIRSQRRQATGGNAVPEREQAMVLRVENLKAGQQLGAYKIYQQGIDLLKYSNLRMFVHMHGRDGMGRELDILPEGEQREKARLFVRLGSNESNDYYEYEQPLTPSAYPRPGADPNPDEVWQTFQPYNGKTIDLNSLNIELAALNRLKFVRDNYERDGHAVLDSMFWSDAEVCEDGCVRGLSDDGSGFAPPGTRLGIKGNPSLNRINTIVIGVRNPSDPFSPEGETLQEVEVWVNELRVSGYDQTNGWAGLANADLRLADLATVRANFKTQTSGFGSLSSTLGDRDQTDLINWSVTTDFKVDKFIPERYGWTIPVSVQVRSQTSTPQFAPSRGDISVEDIVDQYEDDPALSEAERDSLTDAAVREAQRHSVDRSFSMSVQKQGSNSKVLRNTLDGLRLSYSYSDAEARNPSRRLDDSWNWRTSFDYRFSAKARTVRPFGFLDEVPVLSVLSGLDWNYMPQSLSFDGSAARRFTQSQDRPRGDAVQASLPRHFLNPIHDRQNFDHDRGFQLQYNPFQFLNLNFGTDVQQTLNAVGVDTLYSIAVLSPDSSGWTTYDGYSQREALAQGIITPEDEAAGRVRQIHRLNVLSTDEVIEHVATGDGSLRTERYGQRFTASFRPRLDNISWLDWIQLQDVSYSAQYGWSNGPVGQLTGAQVNNSATYKTGVSLKPQTFWRKFDWYVALEDEQKQAESEGVRSQQERQRRTQEQERRRAEEQRRAEEGDDANGEDGTETDAQEEVEGEGDDGSGFKLPLPSPRSVLRRTVLALTGIRDFTVSYSVDHSGRSTNVGRPLFDDAGALVDVENGYNLFDAFNGTAPPLAYRFGFEQRIDQSMRVVNRSVMSDDVQSGHRLQARTSLQPSQALQINLDWNAEWNDQESYSYRLNESDSLVADETSGGRTQASVWAFGADYLDLFERQLRTLADDLAADEPSADGRVVLTSESLAEDFRTAYTRGFGVLGQRRLLPFPMPSWTITYSGLSDWPFLRSVAQRVTLRHGYNATYSTDFRSTAVGAEDPSISLGGETFFYPVPDFLSNSVRVNEAFRPLIGLDISWKGRLQTNVQWSQSNAYQLNTTSRTVSTNKTEEISLSASFSKAGMSLPILPFEAKNTIRFSLTLAHAVSDNRRFDLTSALQEALDDPNAYDSALAIAGDSKVSVLTDTKRLTVAPQLSYTFSQRVSADFTMKYERFDSVELGTSENITGGVNVRVSISN